MNRREWLKSVLSAVVASQIPIDLTPAVNPIHWYGIPYHQSDGTTGTWLGIVRSEYPQFKSTIQEARLTVTPEKINECLENLLTHSE